VGRRDDFFELGGNSLLGMWLTERIVATFDVHVPARRFYEAPTIADLAVAIEELSAAGTATFGS
jgi:phthiocerol/phenolphthiocerol synthesis type-I polyketide synthase E